MEWRDRLIDVPDETISWANPAHEILVWHSAEDHVVIACYLDDRWVNSCAPAFQEHPPVAFRWWQPLPPRPPGTLPPEAWLRRALAEEAGCD